MRRGAPLNEGRLPVVSPNPADLESIDVESYAEGGSYDKAYKSKQSPSSGYGLSIPSGGIGASNMSSSSRSSSHSSLNSSGNYGNYRVSSSNMAGWNQIIFSNLTKFSPESIQKAAFVLLGCTFVLFFILPLTFSILTCIYAAVGLGVFGSLYLSRSVLRCDDGNEAMRAVSDPIREGAEGFLSVQYNVSVIIHVPIFMKLQVVHTHKCKYIHIRYILIFIIQTLNFCISLFLH